MSQKTDTRLEHLQQLNSKKGWINQDLYRLMYREDLYIIAYERIKSKPGNMTPGTDAETLDGFSLATIREIIGEMKTEQCRFRPVRQQFIPKPNGKMRKLGIPFAQFLEGTSRHNIIQTGTNLLTVLVLPINPE